MESIGPYRVVRLLGTGSYSKVFLAEAEDGRQFAVKTASSSSVSSAKHQEAMDRARQEADIMKKLDHPNLVPLVDSIVTSDAVSVVLPFYPGGDLLEHMRKKRTLTEDEARSYFRQLTSAVAYMHKMGYIHRDLKLENVFISKDKRVVLGDLGFAGPWSPTEMQTKSWGSIHYAAPEICTASAYRGPEVDVWSLGVLLYVLVTGKMPFSGQDDWHIYKQIAAGSFRPPTGISSECLQLIKGMLCPSQRDRLSLDAVIAHPWTAAIAVPRLSSLQRRPSYEADVSRGVNSGRASPIDGGMHSMPDPIGHISPLPLDRLTRRRNSVSSLPEVPEECSMAPPSPDSASGSPKSSASSRLSSATSTPRESLSRRPSRFMLSPNTRRFSLSQLVAKLRAEECSASSSAQTPPSPLSTSP